MRRPRINNLRDVHREAQSTRGSQRSENDFPLCAPLRLSGFARAVLTFSRTAGFRHRDRIGHGGDDGWGKDADPAMGDGPRYRLIEGRGGGAVGSAKTISATAWSGLACVRPALSMPSPRGCSGIQIILRYD
jgi:hypothetical protein